DHAAAAERTEVERTAGDLLVALAVIGGAGRRRRLGGCQQTAVMSELGDAHTIRQIAVVADAMEAVGQDVEQEAADELVGVEGHRLSLVMVAIVLPEEADAAVGESDEAAVGDGDAMGIAGEIIEHLLGSAERSLGIDDPANGAQLPQGDSEHFSRGQARQTAEKPELARIERRLEAGQEKPAIEPRQYLHRQKEPRPAANPAGPIGRGPAARHDAVHMGMMMQVLSPG